jgi:hypothetical protein
MIDLAHSGDMVAAGAENEALRGLFEALAVTTNPIPIKAALNLLGHDVGGLRLPLVDAAHGEADMNKHPIADACFDRVIIADDAYQINLAPHVGHVDDTERAIRIRNRDDLSGNA